MKFCGGGVKRVRGACRARCGDYARHARICSAILREEIIFMNGVADEKPKNHERGAVQRGRGSMELMKRAGGEKILGTGFVFLEENDPVPEFFASLRNKRLMDEVRCDKTNTATTYLSSPPSQHARPEVIAVFRTWMLWNPLRNQ